MEEFQKCPNCGKKSPEENLRCIYCSEMLPSSSGVLASFRFGRGRVLFLLIGLLVLSWFVRRYLF